MDKLEFRTLNGSKEGDRRWVTGPRFGRIGFLETVQAGREHDHWSTIIYKLPRSWKAPTVGRGIATGFWFNGTGPASAISQRATPMAPSAWWKARPDIGGSRAVAAMHVAEVLGISRRRGKAPAVGDTDSVGFTSTTGGSGVAFKTGWACYEAALDVKAADD